MGLKQICITTALVSGCNRLLQQGNCLLKTAHMGKILLAEALLRDAVLGPLASSFRSVWPRVCLSLCWSARRLVVCGHDGRYLALAE
jgi:hypothetical protein